jgi:hypothetical protein
MSRTEILDALARLKAKGYATHAIQCGRAGRWESPRSKGTIVIEPGRAGGVCLSLDQFPSIPPRDRASERGIHRYLLSLQNGADLALRDRVACTPDELAALLAWCADLVIARDTGAPDPAPPVETCAEWRRRDGARYIVTGAALTAGTPDRKPRHAEGAPTA